MTHFGEHLTYDGYNGDYTALNCRETVSKALSDLVIAVGMTILSGPEVYFATGNDKKDPGGWTGFVMVMERATSASTPSQRAVSFPPMSIPARTAWTWKPLSNFFVPVSRLPMRKSISSSGVRGTRSTTSANRAMHKLADSRVIA